MLSVHKMPPTMIPINCGAHTRAEFSNQDRFDDGGQKFGINSMRNAARRIDTADRSIRRSGGSPSLVVNRTHNAKVDHLS